MSSYIQANTNGRLHAATEPSLSPLNRGFLYGDAIYEVWRTYHGVIFGWEEHWARLERSAAALHFVLPFTRQDILTEIRKTVAAFRERAPGVAEVYIRLQVTRGCGAIGLDIALADRADFVLLVQENKLFFEEKFRAGLKLSLARELHRNPADALNPAWKTGNYLNNILCLREARARGADEVVITNQAGEITEAAVSNIGFVRDGVVVTPPLSAGILAGITRDLLITKVAPKAGVAVREEAIRPEDLRGMQEAFLLSSTKDLTPVASIDDNVFTLGEDTVTLRLKRAFAEYARASAEANGATLRLW
jgi:branched-subunit amino acid aminotransferase/4-amino-4-deoxychorismate lyase